MEARASINMLNICYSPDGRFVLGKTVPSVLDTARGPRPRAVHKTEGTVFPNTNRPWLVNTACSWNQSDCRICRIPPAHELRKKQLNIINWVDNVDWPPLRVWKLKFRALALRQSEWTNCGLCVRLYAENGAALLLGIGWKQEQTSWMKSARWYRGD